MRVTVHFALWGSLVFAALCIAYGLFGLYSIDSDASAALRSDSQGFAGFWLFLGGVGLASAGASWWTLRQGSSALDD